MPATIFHSSALTNAPKKVLISSADVNEESTGIVKAGIDYVCKGTDLSQVSREMILDAEPPEYPDIVFRDQIVQGRLFQQSRTVETQYGIGKIRAFYVGVLARGQNGNLENEIENFSISFPLSIQDVELLTRATNITTIAQQEGVFNAWAFNGLRNQNDLAQVSISGRITTQRTRFGAVVNTPGALQAINSPSVGQLIVQATAFVSVGRFASRVLRRVFGVAEGESLERALAATYTPAEWLTEFPDNWTITSEIDNEVLTPSVVVVNTVNRFVVTNERPPRFMDMPPTSSEFFSQDLLALQ